MISSKDIAIAFFVGLVGCAAIEVAVNALVAFVTTLLVVVQP